MPTRMHERSTPARAIVGGGVLVGALDGLYAVLASLLRGNDPQRVFMGVASGLIGRETAFAGGTGTVLLGLLLHFGVATLIVITYWALARRFDVLAERPFVCGAIFGLLAYAGMNMVVIPLSAIERAPLDFRPALAGALVHVFLVGIPAALMVRAAVRRQVT